MDGNKKVGQTKFQSFVESSSNTIIGYALGVLTQVLIFPLYHIHISLTTNASLTAWFTSVSLLRSYVIRRWFNKR